MSRVVVSRVVVSRVVVRRVVVSRVVVVSAVHISAPHEQQRPLPRRHFRHLVIGRLRQRCPAAADARQPGEAVVSCQHSPRLLRTLLGGERRPRGRNLEQEQKIRRHQGL